MKQLGREYKKSLSKINKRITLLKKQLKQQQGNKSSCNSDILCLEARLQPLLAMQRDMRELIIELENYYKRGWWRSGKYTHNRGESRLPVIYFRNIFEDELLGQLEPDPEHEENISTGNK